MDVWRYSDWWGLGDQLRNSQKHIWHWRDWIVESLNADLPYDEMIRRMLAADELHPANPDALRATGFLARDYFLFNRNQWMEEVVEHVGKGFYADLVQFMSRGPVDALALEGPEDTWEVVRQMMGATNPRKAAPGTIRGDLGILFTENLVHGSDSLASAEREISIFFPNL
mgnify:CR=1 FL=1